MMIKFVDILQVNEVLIEKVRLWRNKEEIRQYMLDQKVISREEHLNWIRDIKKRLDIKVWIVYFNDIPIGILNLSNINYELLTAEWGFYIGEDNFRGKGLGKLMLFELLEMFFDKMNFNTLHTKVLNKNVVARSLYKKFGFTVINDKYEREKLVKFLIFSKEDWDRRKEVLKNECNYKYKK